MTLSETRDDIGHLVTFMTLSESREDIGYLVTFMTLSESREVQVVPSSASPQLSMVASR